MSPEQALGGTVDHRTDLFSLGVVLVEMLTGKPPFAMETPAELPVQIMRSTVPGPSATDRTIPPELDGVVARMLSKSLEGRSGSAATVAAELRSVASMLGVRSETAEIRDTMPRPPSQQTSALGWLVAMLILLTAGALVWMATRVQ
jgi:serine/threonine-protein kinase